MVTELILNTTLLIALAVLFSFLSRGGTTDSVRQQLLSGVVFGLIAVIGMCIPFTVTRGIIYDGRSIVLSMAGLFGGYLSGILALLIALCYRVYLGGAGVYAGAATIILSALAGLLFRKWNKNVPEQISAFQLYLLGLTSSVVMIGSQLLLPRSKALEVISQTWLPVMVVFPVAELLMGMIFRNEKIRTQAEEELQESEARYRTTLISIGDGIITTNTDGEITFMNPVASFLCGWHADEAVGQKIREVFRTIDEATGNLLPCEIENIINESTARNFTNNSLLINRKGNPVPISNSGAPIRDSKGNITGAVLVFKDQTEERNLKSKIIESERLFQTLTDKSPVGIFRTLSNGYTTYVNPKWCTISGMSREKALGFGWLNAVHPHDRELIEQGWLEATQKQSISTTEYRFLLSNGKVNWVLGVAVPEYNVNGQLQGYIGTAIDITERKIAENEFTQSHENFRQTLDDSPLGIRIVSSTGKTSYANAAFLALYQYNNIDEFENIPVNQRYSAACLQMHESRKQLRQQGQQTENEYEVDILTKTGAIRNLLVIRKSIYWNGENQDMVIYQDFTERKQTEARLRIFERALEQSPVSTIITNNEGQIIYANPKFSEISGFDNSEIIGKNPSFLKSGVHNDNFYKELWNTILSGSEWRGEFLNKRQNGELYWESAVISSIVNEKGQITHFVEAKEDVTEKKKIISDLQQAKEKAEESDRLKSAFLANMSHEIRTPLNAIMGFTNLLIENDNLDEESKAEFSSIVYQSSENLVQIINDILDISKIETGQLHMYPTSFNVQQVIQELYAIACQQREKLDKDHIAISYHISIENLNLHTDKVRFIQIFNNLLNNAIKFTEQGEINFGVSEVTKTEVIFFVTDTGIGIDPELQYHIFDRFRQADDSSTRLYGGTGLGLSISKKLVEQMGGSISLQSIPKRGTTFQFTIPIAPYSEVQ